MLHPYQGTGAIASEQDLISACLQLRQDYEQLKPTDKKALETLRQKAYELEGQWLDLPAVEEDHEDLPPIPEPIEWLLNKLDSATPLTAYSHDAEPLVIDVDQWLEDATALLKEGWQDFDRFKFGDEVQMTKNRHSCDNSTKGDLAEQASLLSMQYDLIEPVTRHSRLFELWLVRTELENHLDPIQETIEYELEEYDKKKAAELRAQGKDHLAAQWLLPKHQRERPKNCSDEQWANIITPFNRKNIDEPFEEFLAGVELARRGLRAKQGFSRKESLQSHLDEAHTQIREAIESGATAADVQEQINQQFAEYNQAGLARFAEQYREEQERRQDLHDALDDLLLRGQRPEIHLADYVPCSWLPMFRVLKDGLKFKDDAIVMTIMAGVASMLNPKLRIRGMSMEEIPTVWLFLIGSSGTAKSVLLKSLITAPMAKPLDLVDSWNEAEQQRREAADNGENLPSFRKRNLIYTAPTTQGIRADLAEHGANLPGVLVRDELNGWLKQMADESGAGVGDVEFWLSSYDGAYSNDVFADAKKSRQVREGKLSVIGGIQPNVFLGQLEAGNANGFNSRPLFVSIPRIKRSLVHPDEQTEKLPERLGNVYLAALKDDCKSYVLSEAAATLFDSLFNQIEDLALSAGGDEIEALWSKGAGQVLRVAAAIHFLRVATGQEMLVKQNYLKTQEVVSERSLQLAANLVLAGKTRAVELHERAANPMLEMADQLLEKAKKFQGKANGKGVALSAIRKSWSSKNRPTLADLKQLAVMLQSRGMVQLLEGGKSIRAVR